MSEAVPPLTPPDLSRLGPGLRDALEEVFDFSDFTAWPISSYSGPLPPVTLSRHQVERAAEAVAGGTGFWDRINRQVILPLLADGISLGVLAFAGIDRSVGPEEAARWLPVLKAFAEARLSLLRQKTSLAPAGTIPEYVGLALEDLYRPGGDRSFSVIHLTWGRGPVAQGRPAGTYGWRDLVGFCARPWVPRPVSWLGGSPRDAWMLILDCDGERLSCGMRKIAAAACKIRFPIAGMYGHAFSEGDVPTRTLEELRRTRRAAGELKTLVLCSHDLRALEERTGIEEMGGTLEGARKAMRGRKGTITAFARPVSRAMARRLEKEAVILRTGVGAFLIRHGDTGSSRSTALHAWADRIQAVGRAVQAHTPTVGLADGAQGLWRASVCALQAYLHADLLGQGSFAVFDALTCNVAGDEFFSWGDLSGACSAYRAGLKLAPADPNLLNSLGVCLAEMGREGDALKAFSAAAGLSPRDFMAHYNKGGVLLDTGRLDEAENALREAFRLQPEDPRVAVRLADVLIRAGRPAGAVEILEPLARGGGDDLPGAVFRFLGRACYEAEKWQEAKKAWHEALGRNAADPETLALLALGYVRNEGDRETSMRLYRQARSLGGEENRGLRDLLHRLEKVLTP